MTISSTPEPTRRPVVQPIHDFPHRGGLLLRGVTRRCAWCGDRKGYFLGWFKRQDACRRCGHGFRRGDEAFELGATTANIILTFLTILISIALMVGLTAPDIPVVPVMAITVLVAIAGPAVYYPVSFTLWQAVDLWMRPPTKSELAGEGDAEL